MRMLKEEFRETFLFKRMPKGKECERTRRPVPRKRHSFLALRKDGLCRRRPESPRPLEDGDRHWYKSAMDGDISEIKYLLERDPDMVDKKTALHWAAKKGYIEMTELLAGTGMDVNIKTGYTALHFAVIHYHEAIISILVDDYGANINIRDNSGRKPKHYLKDNTSPWIQRKLGKSVKLSVSFSKNGALAKGLGTFGNLLVPASPLSSSLETGLNDIGIDDDNGEQNASNTQRRVSKSFFDSTAQ
ncbi:Ankyrin repeat domain-containing protein SOWAHC [Exaiptasia diaphana]|nr:Ankyrin repeat domain-containing protein SOWAHC [Exaiptasia diaphana]